MSECKPISQQSRLPLSIKNLKKFIDLGLIHEIEMKGRESRYDANMDPHHHIINLSTEEVTDLDTQKVGEVHVPAEVMEYDLENISINFFVRNKPDQSRYDRLKRQVSNNR